jgi:hypothetical protein
MIRLVVIIIFIFNITCSSAVKSNESVEPPKNEKSPSLFFTPAGPNETIIDEKGEETKISDLDPAEFQKPSKDPQETFRVYINGDGYKLRQIRNSKLLRRKVDTGGDALVVDEIKKFDGKVDFIDDGLVMFKLNPKTARLENVNFHTRVPRIGDLSKIVQNDATRWSMQFLTEEPVKSFLVVYYIQLRGNASKDQVKEELKKEVKK